MRTPSFSRSDYLAAADVIGKATAHRPTVGLILGSGLGALADSVEAASTIPYEQIPLWPRSTVAGHQGRLVIGRLEGQTVMVLQGRVHFYEGYSIQEIAFPVRVMQAMGVQTLIVTNAAGGINKSYVSGDLMLISDHINFPGMVGNNPLVGPNDEQLGPRFPDMSSAYDGKLRALARRVAAQAGFTLHEGVYACLSGPNFETPAEIRMLRAIGADAVGMSTAPEVVAARHAGIRVMGVSGISNATIDTVDSSLKTSHEEVLYNMNNSIVPKLATLIRGVLSSMESV
jgi:purine-nucleoside phosphorylase